MAQLVATIIEDGPIDVPAVADQGRLLLDAAALERATGWALKPEGLCRGEVCVPTRMWPEVFAGDPDAGLVDLAVVARLVGRLAAVDADEGVAVLGAPADERAAELGSLQAYEFTATTVDGEQVALADFRGRKKLLVAFASW